MSRPYPTRVRLGGTPLGVEGGKGRSFAPREAKPWGNPLCLPPGEGLPSGSRAPLCPPKEEEEEAIEWEGEEEEGTHVPTSSGEMPACFPTEGAWPLGVASFPPEERELLSAYIPPKYLPIYSAAKVHSVLSEMDLLTIYHQRKTAEELAEKRRIQQEQTRRLELAPPAPPQVLRPKNQPGRGPPKRVLHKRRTFQLGELLEMIGVPTDTRHYRHANTKPTPIHRAWPTQLPLEASCNADIVFANAAPVPPERTQGPVLWMQSSRKPTRLVSTLDDMHSGIRLDAQVSPETREVWLMEYAERDPLIQPVVGMGGVITHVTRKRSTGTSAVSAVPPYGHMIRLEKDEPSPILCEIAPEDLITLLRTDVSNVPTFEHTIHTDFLLTRSTLRPKRVLAHPISRTFCLGQVEPKVEIPSPHEIHTPRVATFVARWIKFHVLRRLIDSSEMRIPESCLANMFPCIATATIDRALRELVVRQGRFLVPKQGASAPVSRAALEDRLYEHMEHIRPVDIAKWYAYLAAMRRVGEAGITHMVHVDIATTLAAYRLIHDLFFASMKMGEKRGGPLPSRVRAQMKAALHVCRELECSSWYLSYCFRWLFREAENVHNPFPKMTVMQVAGVGEPSGCGDMVSFLPNYSRVEGNHSLGGGTPSSSAYEPELFYDFSEARNRTRKKRSHYRKSTKSDISGTKNDIRTVKMEKLGDILVQLGIPQETVRGIDRWDRTWMIQTIATDHPDGKYLLGGDLEKYARTTLTEGVYSESIRERLDSSMQDENLDRQDLERSDHYIAFRQVATASHKRMREALLHAPRPPILVRSSSGEEEPEEVDEDMEAFAKNLAQSMMDAPTPPPPQPPKKRARRGRRDPSSSTYEALSERGELERFQAERAKDQQRLAEREILRREEAEIQAFVQQTSTLPRRRYIQRTIVSILPDQSKEVRVEFHRI